MAGVVMPGEGVESWLYKGFFPAGRRLLVQWREDVHTASRDGAISWAALIEISGAGSALPWKWRMLPPGRPGNSMLCGSYCTLPQSLFSAP